MFDRINNSRSNNQSVNVEAVSGGIGKSHPKSVIRRMHVSSNLSKWLFGDNPHVATIDCNGFKKNKRDVVVLQVVIHDTECIFVEYIEKDEYEKGLELESMKGHENG